jgi:hypothetical protein
VTIVSKRRPYQRRATYVKLLHGLDVFLAGLTGFVVGIVEFLLREEFGRGIGIGAPTTRCHSFD